MRTRSRLAATFVISACAMFVFVFIVRSVYTIHAEPDTAHAKHEPEFVEDDGSAEVKELVSAFGKQLQTVTLTTAPETAAANIEAAYADFVSDDLLQRWKDDPSNAPGRYTSSSWPDHIVISSITTYADNTYVVNGDVIEMMSAEATDAGEADRYPIQITIAQENGQWTITDCEKIEE